MAVSRARGAPSPVSSSSFSSSRLGWLACCTRQITSFSGLIHDGLIIIGCFAPAILIYLLSLVICLWTSWTSRDGFPLVDSFSTRRLASMPLTVKIAEAEPSDLVLDPSRLCARSSDKAIELFSQNRLEWKLSLFGKSDIRQLIIILQVCLRPI